MTEKKTAKETWSDRIMKIDKAVKLLIADVKELKAHTLEPDAHNPATIHRKKKK